MNYLFTIALIVFTTIIANSNCIDGKASENGETQTGDKQVKVPEFTGGIKLENVPIFVNLVVKALFDSPNCHKERRKEGNFHVENGKCLITGNGLEILKQVKYPCKIQVDIGQLKEHELLKNDLKIMSKGKTIWERYTTEWGHSSEAIRGDLIFYILDEVKDKLLELTDRRVIEKIAVCQGIPPKPLSHPPTAVDQHKGSEQKSMSGAGQPSLKKNKINGDDKVLFGNPKLRVSPKQLAKTIVRNEYNKENDEDDDADDDDE